MSDSTAETETTTERKPPTLADIVREKTDDGRLIIDFFTDVMMGKVDGAELCHRIDAAKQLVKYGSEEAVIFIAKYKDIPCGHSTHGRPNQADPCTNEDRTLVAVTLNAPPTLTREFLTVLSGIDEFLMARLIRAQTVDGGTIIDFLYDVMQDTTEGFKTHHRIAAAKELIVHIIRDEQPSPTPSPAHPTVVPVETGTHPSDPALSSLEGPADNPTVVPEKSGTHPSDPAPSSLEEPANNLTVVPVETGTHPSDPAPSSAEEPANNPSVVPEKSGTHPSDPALSSLEEPADNLTVVPVETGTHPSDPALSSLEGPADNPTVVPVETGTHPSDPAPSSLEEPADNTTVVPKKSGTHGRGGARTTAANSVSQLTTNNSKPRTLPRRRRTRTQRRREGAAKAALKKESERTREEKPAPAEITPTERRIRERLEQHWHEPDPYGAPIDSTHPGRSPPL